MNRCMYFTFLAITSSQLAITAISGLGTTLLEGDIYVEVIAGVYSELHDNGTCSGIDSESVQNLAAIKWTFSELNKGLGYIQGARIGVRVSETCRSLQRAKALAFKLADEIKSGSSDVMGVIGSEYSSETDVISRLLSALPDQQRLLQIGYASTSAFLRDRNIYGNFFRVIPPDDIQVEVMLEIMTRLRWTYMALIYGDDAYGIGGKNSLLAEAKSRDVCFPIQIPVDPNENNITKLEEEIQIRILNAETPIGGVLVFGSYYLAQFVLTATENMLLKFPNSTRPVFLFSETAGYIEGHPTNISKGAFVVSPPRRTVDEFQAQWMQLFKSIPTLYDEIKSNRWLREVFVTNFGCDLAQDYKSNTCANVTEAVLKNKIPPSVYNQYAIQASMLMANVIRQVQIQKCGSQKRVCPEMLNTSRHILIDIMEHMTVNFDQDFGTLRIPAFQDPSDLTLTFNDTVDGSIPSGFPVYEVYSHQVCGTQTKERCFIKVAQFNKETGLDVLTSIIKDYDENGTEHRWPDIRKPQCPDGHICLYCGDSSADDNTLFIPGDMYVVGVVPVHNVGPSPLKCAGIRQGALDIVEAIRFAVDETKRTYPDELPETNIGIIVIDGCNDPQIVEEKMLNLHRLGVYKNNAYIPVEDKIIGYIGGCTSSSSAAIGAITTRLEFPQISYASTAPVLGKKAIYPYFLRVPSPDGEQARAMVNIVKDLNANFIQIVYSMSTYGESGRHLLLELVKDMKICVAQSIAVTPLFDPGDVMQSLRQYPDAKVVVMFIGSAEIEPLAKHLNEHLDRNEFLLKSSETWGTRVSVDDYINIIGSITMASELPMNDKFIDHMKKLKPDGSNINPWIRPYMENYFQCYYEWSYNKMSRKKCTRDEVLDVHKQQYRIDARSPFTEKAVLALLKGARFALEQYCGSSSTICDDLRNNTQGFVDILTNVRLIDANGFHSRVFDDNGDGLAGYKIYAVDMNTEGNYKQIGTSEPNGFIFYKQKLESLRGEVLMSTCGTQDVCQHCFPVPTVQEKQYFTTGLIALSILLGVVCCILVVILVCICKRRGSCFKIEDGRLRFTSTYLETANRAGDDNYDTIQCSRCTCGSSVDEKGETSRKDTEKSGITSSCDRATLGHSESNQLGLSNSNIAGYNRRGSTTEESGPGTINFGEKTVVYRPHLDSYLEPNPLDKHLYRKTSSANSDYNRIHSSVIETNEMGIQGGQTRYTDADDENTDDTKGTHEYDSDYLHCV